MPTSKYANLPDVDTSAADVFETEDAGYTAGNNQDAYDSDDSLSRLNLLSSTIGAGRSKGVNPGQAEHIDGRSLPSRKEAGKAFGKRRGDNGSVYTFRPRLPPVHLKRYESSSESDSDEDTKEATARRTPRFREDPVNKLRRLKLECLELQRQLELDAQTTANQDEEKQVVTEETEAETGGRKSRAKKPDTHALMAQLLELRAGLDKTEQSTILRAGNAGADQEKLKVRAEASKGLVEGLGAKPTSTTGGSDQASKPVEVRPSSIEQVQDVQIVSELDRRLDLLEKRIGAGIDTASAPVPILSSLSRMESILTMLSQTDQLDGVSKQVKLVLADLDKTRSTPNTKTGMPLDRSDGKNASDLKLKPSDAEKVDAIYTALPRIEPLVPLLPPLLTRLRSLASLHAGASSVQSTLTRLESDTANMKETDAEVKEVLDRLDEGITKQAEAMKGNWKSLSERLELLNERVAKLQ